MKYFATLKLKDIVVLAILILAGLGWIMIDQFFLPYSYQRFIALFVFGIALFYLHYVINKPDRIWPYANSIALVCVLTVMIIIIVLQVIILHDFSSKSFLIWIITGTLPYLAGIIYSKVRSNN